MTTQQHVEYDFLVKVFDDGGSFHFDRISAWDRTDLNEQDNIYHEGTIYAEDGKEYGIEIRIWFEDTSWLSEECEDVVDGVIDHIRTYVSHLLIPTDFYVKGYLQ